MKFKLVILFLLILGTIKSQKIDTIIDAGIYKSYFNIQLRQPVYVSYVLYHGGGECNRKSFNFKNDTKIKTATSKDYSHSGYDQGHLANAEDFAYNCLMDEKTFRFYNCLPQTSNLNRGIWKEWENKIRNESQTDSLYIVCGGVFGKKKIGECAVPTACWKLVKSLLSNKILYALYFTNKKENNIVKELTQKQLEKILGYKIPM